MTGLIVFKILKVFLEDKRLQLGATSVERTLESLSSSAGTKLRHIIFIIIESGMALFAIQLVRVVIISVIIGTAGQTPLLANLLTTSDLVIGIHQMLNVIINICSFYFIFLLMTFTYLLLRASHQQ